MDSPRYLEAMVSRVHSNPPTIKLKQGDVPFLMLSPPRLHASCQGRACCRFLLDFNGVHHVEKDETWATLFSTRLPTANCCGQASSSQNQIHKIEHTCPLEQQIKTNPTLNNGGPTHCEATRPPQCKDSRAAHACGRRFERNCEWFVAVIRNAPKTAS